MYPGNPLRCIAYNIIAVYHENIGFVYCSHAGKALHAFFYCGFLPNSSFQTILSGILLSLHQTGPSECQTLWIQAHTSFRALSIEPNCLQRLPAGNTGRHQSPLQQTINFATYFLIFEKKTQVSGMIFHEYRLPAEDSHEISCLICNGKDVHYS